MPAWNDPPPYRNEFHFIGPHKNLWDLQNEMNQRGNDEHPWQIHGWDKLDGEWYGLMYRSIDKVDDDKEKVDRR